MLNLLRLTSVWLITATVGFAAVLIPEYTSVQLQNKQFVRDEIVRLSGIRENLLKQSENATDVVRMTVKRDLQKVDSALEALRYVESAGFRKDDPELAKLSYFQSSKKPFESGFKHNMKRVGPPGGRISFLDNPPKSPPSATPTPEELEQMRRNLPPPPPNSRAPKRN